jgi:hypothetical protein
MILLTRDLRECLSPTAASAMWTTRCANVPSDSGHKSLHALPAESARADSWIADALNSAGYRGALMATVKRIVARASGVLVTNVAGNRFRTVFADGVTALEAAIQMEESKT